MNGGAKNIKGPLRANSAEDHSALGGPVQIMPKEGDRNSWLYQAWNQQESLPE